MYVQKRILMRARVFDDAVKYQGHSPNALTSKFCSTPSHRG